MPQITVQDLSKTYRVAERRRGLVGLWRGLFYRTHREIEALKGVSFSLDRGELVGIIGPNGAGKSTLIKILCGILMPSSGACEIDGRVPWTDRIRHVARIGVVFGPTLAVVVGPACHRQLQPASRYLPCAGS